MARPRSIGAAVQVEFLDESMVAALVERQELRPLFRPPDRGRAVTRRLGAHHQPLERSRQQATRPLSLGLDPQSVRLAAHILGGGQEIPAPESDGVCGPTTRDCRFECGHVQVDDARLQHHGLGSDSQPFVQCAPKHEEHLS